MAKFFIALFLVIGFSPVSKADVNVRVDPLSALIGLFSVDVDIPISQAWTLGPTARFMDRTDGDFDVSAYGFGVRANYWFEDAVFTQGWYFGPSVQYVSVSVEDNESTTNLKGDATGVALIGIFGYQWMWESFNINLGIGPAYYSISKITAKDNQGNSDEYKGYNGAGLSLEFSLGWKF